MFQRDVRVLPGVVVGASAAAAGEIVFDFASAGQIFVKTGDTIATITWYGAPAPGGSFLPIYDGDGNAITSTIAKDQSCLIPAACFACGALKAVGNAAGTIDVSLKS